MFVLSKNVTNSWTLLFGFRYQTHNDALEIEFSYVDPETDIREYRVTIYEQYGGENTRFYPTTVSPSYESITPPGQCIFRKLIIILDNEILVMATVEKESSTCSPFCDLYSPTTSSLIVSLFFNCCCWFKQYLMQHVVKKC